MVASPPPYGTIPQGLPPLLGIYPYSGGARKWNIPRGWGEGGRGENTKRVGRPQNHLL